MSDALRHVPPVTIANALATGLLLNLDGEQQLFPWALVEEVCVGTARTPMGDMFTLALQLSIGRTIVAFEQQAIWPKLIEQLSAGLPAVEPFAVWGPQLIDDPAAAIFIYERQGEAGS